MLLHVSHEVEYIHVRWDAECKLWSVNVFKRNEYLKKSLFQLISMYDLLCDLLVEQVTGWSCWSSGMNLEVPLMSFEKCWKKSGIVLYHLKRRLSSGKRWKIICEHYHSYHVSVEEHQIRHVPWKAWLFKCLHILNMSCNIVKLGGRIFTPRVRVVPYTSFCVQCL